LYLVTLTFDILTPKQDSQWNISVSSLVILAASVFEILCGKTDRQTDKHTNAAEHPTHSTVVGMDNDNHEEKD